MREVKDTAPHTEYIEQWKTCVDVIKNNNSKRNASNIAFIGLAISSFYIMYASEFAISWIYIIAVVVCSAGWALTIYSYKKANNELYEAIGKIEAQWNIKVFSGKHKKNRFLLSYEYIFPILVSCISILLYYFKNIQC